MSLTFKDPPLNLGKFFTDYCSRNPTAYSDYKMVGLKEVIQAEEDRYDYKLRLQEEAEQQNIKPHRMLKFKKEQDKQAIWKNIIPPKLME